MNHLLLALPLVLLGTRADLDQASPRPNIIFLFADDQRADTIGAYGNPHIQTPAIDSLVRRGFNFRNAYCMGSVHGAVCIPSRAMLMSGQDLFSVRMDLAETRTLPQALAEAGYETFGTGKWHNGEASFDASFQSGSNVFFGGMCDHTQVPLRDKPKGGRLSEKRKGDGFSSELFADAAIEFLTSDRDEEQPFFVYVAFSAPHDPRQPPVMWRETYYENQPPLPANFLPQHPFHNGWMNGRDENLAPWPRTEEVISGQLAEYYGMISHMDEQIARILSALEASGQAENTLIVYTADHGLALGSHGLLGKQSLYEHSMKSPLVIAGPGVPHGSSDALTYLFDLVPTLCEIAGAAPSSDLAGSDLAPIIQGIEGEVPALRTQLFTSYEDKMRALRDERWKLIRYPLLNHTQLFDLSLDPDEMNDLSASPEEAPRIERMLVDLARWQARFGDDQPLTTDNPNPMDYDPSSWKRESDPWQPDWIREKYFGQ